MSDQTYTYGAKYICIRQADDQPGAQYEPIAQCLSGHYDSPSWEGHAAFLVEAANSYASSQAEIERLRTLEADLWHLSLVIESAVREADFPNHADVLALIKSIKRPAAALSGSK